jgi:DNA-nicking Smr family endonuclease
MKKKKPIAPKPKEFASTPFSALKGIKPVVTESHATKVQKPAPAKKAESDDMELFLAAMNGVAKFGSTNSTKKPLQPPPVTPMKAVARKIEESEQKLFLEAIRSLHLDVRFQDETPEDTATATPRPVSRIKQLRRGTIRLDYELDLHGLTREEATHALETFIKGAYRRGQQAVLIITGRGNHSPDEPVLKRSTEKWLKEKESMIAEFLTAPSQFGGDGAIIVFLKKNPELKNPSEVS